MFDLKNVRYKDILNIENLHIEKGHITCIIGESGSGKTTLLRLLNNLASCDSGSVSYRGIDVNEMDPVELRRKVVMLPQVPAVFDGNIRDNMLAGLKFSDRPDASENDLVEMLNIVHLPKNLMDDAAKLSGGEKQRLALARVLLMQPETFLLDEPSSALDNETERLVMDSTAKHVKQKGGTLVVVTHSRDLAREFGERLIELKKGCVLGREGRSA